MPETNSIGLLGRIPGREHLRLVEEREPTRCCWLAFDTNFIALGQSVRS